MSLELVNVASQAELRCRCRTSSTLAVRAFWRRAVKTRHGSLSLVGFGSINKPARLDHRDIPRRWSGPSDAGRPQRPNSFSLPWQSREPKSQESAHDEGNQETVDAERRLLSHRLRRPFDHLHRMGGKQGMFQINQHIRP